MASRSLLPVLEVLFGAVAWTLAMAWLDRSRSAAKPGAANVLRYPWSILALGTIIGVGSLVGAVLSFASPTGGRLVAMVFVAFAILGAHLTMEYWLVRFEVSSEGLSFHAPLARHGMLEWHDISRVSWKWLAGRFILTSSTGRRLRVSAMLRGLPAFANGVLSNVPGDRIEASAAIELEAAAKGVLPTVC